MKGFTMLPLVFPGIVMGIAILKMYLILPIPVYGTIWILVLMGKSSSDILAGLKRAFS